MLLPIRVLSLMQVSNNYLLLSHICEHCLFLGAHTKDFCEENVPKSPDFEECFFSPEIAILKQLIPGDCQNIARFLKFSTFLSDIDPNYLANSSFG
jgi:hypothetical protein